MEITKCMREVIRAAHQFRNNSAQLAYLLGQLETLQTVSSRTSHIRQLQSDDHVEVVECVTFLVDVIREEQSHLELIQRAVSILLNLSHDEFVRNQLFETFHVCPLLVSLVVTCSELTENEGILSQTLQLLQRVTYSHRIDYHQANVENLLKFLIPHVLEGTDSLLSPVLGTLANLCRNNLLVQAAIRNRWQTDLKKLLKTLCGLFSSQNQLLSIFSLSVFTSLCLNESEGQKVYFEGNNVEQILQTIFGIIKNNYKSVAWKYAADLLMDLLRHPQMQICIRKYRHLPKCMNDILSLLASGSEESIAGMFELLLSLCTISSVRQSVNNRLFSSLSQNSITLSQMLEATRQPLTPDTEPLLCCLHWSAQDVSPRNRVSCLAVEFLMDSCQDCLCGPETSYPVHLLTPVFTDLLSRPEQTNSPDKTIRLVRLLSALTSDKQSKVLLGQHLKLDTVANLTDKLLSQSYITFAAATSTLQGTDDARETGCQCVLLVLDLARGLRKCIPGMPQYLTTTLKETRVMDFLALGLTSTNQEQVEIALRLLCFTMGMEDAHPDVSLCASIACLNKQKQSSKRLRVDSDSPSRHCTKIDNILQNKENRPRPLLSSTPVSQLESTGKASYDRANRDEAPVESLIEKMEDIMGNKDTKTAEVIEVFEHQIKTLQIKEEHLNDLLEAKTLSLTQADRVIAQLRGREASHFAEMKKLQNGLKESGRKIEQMVSQMNDMRMEAEKMQEQFETKLSGKREEMETLSKEKDEVVEKCSELETRLTNCKQEKKTLSSMMDALQEAHETLKEQYSRSCDQSKQLEEERKTLSKQLKEKDATVQKLSSNLQTVQSKYKETEEERAELEKERDNMETYVDKLRHQLSTSETSCRQLQQRVTILENVSQEQEQKLKSKSDRVSELEAELEKHNQIVSFINNMQLKGAKK